MLSTKHARKGPVSAEVDRWRAEAPAEERGTLLVEIGRGGDVAKINRELKAVGAEIVSSGPALVIVTIVSTAVPHLATIPGVMRISLPQRYVSAPLSADLPSPGAAPVPLSPTSAPPRRAGRYFDPDE